jgi:hypothetical protein
MAGGRERDGASPNLPSRLAFLPSKPYFRPDAAADRQLSARLGLGSAAAARGIVALAPTDEAAPSSLLHPPKVSTNPQP